MFRIFKRTREQIFNKDKETFNEDEELFSSLEKEGIQLTKNEIQKAKNGDGETLFEIGKKYYVDKDYVKALAWFLKAAAQNNSRAQNGIGFMYHLGEGVPRDYQQALDWYLKAVNNDGHSDAQLNIGLMYDYGEGVPQDYKQAMDWYIKAVNTDGHSGAQFNIGVLYEHGYGVPKNILTAIGWYTKAANQGISPAQYSLGAIYENESEVKDLQKSMEWYQKAANNGHEKAKQGIKRLNEEGYYPKDEEKEDEKKAEQLLQPIKTADSNKLKNNVNDEVVTDNKKLLESPSTTENTDLINQLVEKKIKKLEEAFQIKIDLLQQDKKDRDALRQRLAVYEQKLSKTEAEQKEKDEEIRQLKEALLQARPVSDGDPRNDNCYDSSNEISKHGDDNRNCDSKKEDNNGDDYQIDINYDSPSDNDNEDDCKSKPNYDSSGTQNGSRGLSYDG